MQAQDIQAIRHSLGLGRTEFAHLLGLGKTGERTVRGWETGEHAPSALKVALIQHLAATLAQAHANAPFAQDPHADYDFRFIDLFAGIGGIRLPFQQRGGRCVFTSEWDKFAQKTYLANYGDMPKGDITQVSAKDVPDHELVLAGFPCQAFSQAGLKQGFQDARGTLFFEIYKLLAAKRPPMFLLENVKQLRSHDQGRTLATILSLLRGESSQMIDADLTMSAEARAALGIPLNYWVDARVLSAADFGIPQHRERLFIVGFDQDYFKGWDMASLFQWPTPPQTPTAVGDILESAAALARYPKPFTLSDKLWAGHQRRKAEHRQKGNGFGYSLVNPTSAYTNTLSARYYKDGSEILVDQTPLGLPPRKLTPREAARLQGFPEEFIVDAVSQGQAYKQLGNSVCVRVVDAVAAQMLAVWRAFGQQR